MTPKNIINASPPERTKSLRMTANRLGDICLRRQEAELSAASISASESTSENVEPVFNDVLKKDLPKLVELDAAGNLLKEKPKKSRKKKAVEEVS